MNGVPELEDVIRLPVRWGLRISSFAQLALSGDLSGEGGDFDRHLAADYLRLIGDKDTPEARFFKEKE